MGYRRPEQSSPNLPNNFHPHEIERKAERSQQAHTENEWPLYRCFDRSTAHFFDLFFENHTAKKTHFRRVDRHKHARVEALPLVSPRREGQIVFLTSSTGASAVRWTFYCARVASAPSSKHIPVRGPPEGTVRGDPAAAAPTDDAGDPGRIGHGRKFLSLTYCGATINDARRIHL